jgi:DNA-binding response OmpR family regulator
MRVLVIEDEPRIFAFVKAALESEGMTVDGANAGLPGSRMALARTYDLVVLDLSLPDTNGLRVLDRLRRGKPELPVLILSARSELRAKLLSFELGASDYLTKPFALAELLARVRVQLRRSMTREGLRVIAGPLELDVLRRQVHVDGEAIDLSHREFALLHYLVEREGKVVSRERLLADVWGIDFDPKTNVVDVCVRRLRRKLKHGGSIETVRNAGYRMATEPAVLSLLGEPVGERTSRCAAS